MDGKGKKDGIGARSIPNQQKSDKKDEEVANTERTTLESIPLLCAVALALEQLLLLCFRRSRPRRLRASSVFLLKEKEQLHSTEVKKKAKNKSHISFLSVGCLQRDHHWRAAAVDNSWDRRILTRSESTQHEHTPSREGIEETKSAKLYCLVDVFSSYFRSLKPASLQLNRNGRIRNVKKVKEGDKA
jgi:hypothetical protein